MIFENNHIYHIYNQGNNRQKIFFSRENYLFFLKKIKTHILPHADIVAWCLMPNHFHLMIYVKAVEIQQTHLMSKNMAEIGSTTSSRATNATETQQTHLMSETHLMSKNAAEIGSTTSSRATNADRTRTAKMQNLNKSIAILLTSYTRAINSQENRSGSLFKPHTKAECLTKINGITPVFFGSQINVRIPEKEYPQICFDYIHNNPVKAGMVSNPEEYEFSSYRDFAGLRDGKLINRERANELGLFIHSCL